MTPARPHESAYTRALLTRAPSAFHDVYLFRRNVGAMKIKDRYFKAGIAGQCDLYALRDGGAHYEIEIKRGTKLSDAQQRWREWCLLRGIPWTVLDVAKGELPAATIQRWVGELGRFFDGG